MLSSLKRYRYQVPDDGWAKLAEEWTPAVSAQGWARTLREIVGLAMGGPADAQAHPHAGAVYALYISAHKQGQGLGRRLVQAVAADLVQKGMTALEIGCLAANTPARGFYEAIGGRLAGERPFDEDGVLLPEVVYAWADIQHLAAKAEPDERRPA